MGAAELTRFWTQHFGAMAPLGFRLRIELPERWTRVHSLPNAKRYADTPAEETEVLARMNAAAGAVLGADAPCWLIAGEWCLEPDGSLAELPGVELAHRVIAADEAIEPGAPEPYAGAQVLWRSGAFDRLLASIASDLRCALWVSARSGAVFAPYDGGADLIAPSTAERDALAERFAAWRSPRPDGL